MLIQPCQRGGRAAPGRAGACHGATRARE